MKLLNKIKSRNSNSNDSTKEKSGNLFSKKSKIKSILSYIYQFFWRHINISFIYKIAIKEKYDVEIAFLEGISAKIISHSNNKDSKKISWIHVDMINERKTEKFFKNINEEKKCYNKFDQIICVSEVVKNQFVKKYGYDKNKILVKYNPINQNEIESKSNEDISVLKNKFTFCTIGRLSSQKGYDRLINIVSKLNRNGFVFDVWIIGVGAEEGNLKKMIFDLNVENVHFLGYKKNPYPYIKKADSFVCSSRAEGFSTVVSEAIILEKPVVTTNCSGMEELLGNNSEYGLVCDNNEYALYAGMKKFMTDKNLLEHYTKKASVRKKIFNIKKSVKEIEELIK